jgi:uncharacterized protein
LPEHRAGSASGRGVRIVRDESTPHDLDIAVFQESDEGYLPLALKYRRLLRSVAARIPVDVLPLRVHGAAGEFLKEVEQGEVVYVR